VLISTPKLSRSPALTAAEVLETETQLKLFHERALPDLGSNIKCGNSLIGPDFYENQQMLLLDDDGRYRINVFNWKQGFQLAMKEGGFDAIIGNPPYGASLTDPETEYLRSSYKVVNNELDTYALFMEKAISIAKPGSPISMIVPTGWYSGVKFSRLRQYRSTKQPTGFREPPIRHLCGLGGYDNLRIDETGNHSSLAAKGKADCSHPYLPKALSYQEFGRKSSRTKKWLILLDGSKTEEMSI